MEYSSLWFELQAAGDMATHKLVSPLSPKRQIAKLLELVELSNDTLSSDERRLATKRYTRYLCAVVSDAKSQARELSAGFAALSKIYGASPLPDSETRILILQTVLEIWGTLPDDKQVTADMMFRWLLKSFRNSYGNDIAEGLLKKLRDPNFRIARSTLKRAVIIICEERCTDSVLKLLRSLLILWTEKVIGYGSEESFAEIRAWMKWSEGLSA